MALSKKEQWLLKTARSKFVPHNFKGRICGKAYCVQCGLIWLNNDATRKAVKQLCDVGEDD